MPTATFAQLCGHLETVTDSSASVFDLYHDISCSPIHKHLAYTNIYGFILLSGSI